MKINDVSINNKMSEFITINTEKIIDDFDEDYLISTIKLFLEETYVDNLNKMEEGYKNKDKSKIKVAAHTVKSSSGYLGCPYFSKQCEKMEELAKNGTWEDVEGFWKEFRTNYELLYNNAKKVYDEFTKKKEEENNLDNIMEDNSETKIDSTKYMIIEFEFNIGEIRSDKLKQDIGDKVFLAKLKSFVESEYDDVKNKVNTAYQNKDIMQLSESIDNIKNYASFFGFYYVVERVDEALKLLRSNVNVKVEENFINSFLSMIEFIFKECKQTKDNEKMTNNEHLNRLINIAQSKKQQQVTSSDTTTRLNTLVNNNNGPNPIQQSIFSKQKESPGLKKSTIGVTAATPSATNPKNDDIYRKLHKVKFEGLYKKEYDVKTFNEEIQKILTPITEEKKIKKIGKSKISNPNEYKVNNDYPFKQEKYSCFIF